MFTPDIYELVQAYAKIGVSDWKGEKRRHEKAVKSCIAPIHIGESDHDASQVAASGFNKLLPVPLSQGLYPAFFHIDLQQTGNQQHIRIEFLAIFEEGHSLAFRIERADTDDMAHGYPHSQLSRKMLIAKTIEVAGIPPKINTSYPAFLFPMTSTEASFLSFAMAVHGLHGGITEILQRMFSAFKARAYGDHLKESFR